jgi:MFS superfamily sulfate permease-like transporter
MLDLICGIVLGVVVSIVALLGLSVFMAYVTQSHDHDSELHNDD